MALAELLRKAQLERATNFLRDGGRVLSQALMAAEVTQHGGAERHERHERRGERPGQRNGSRDRVGDTRVGTIDLRVPQVRDGSFFPRMREPRKRAEQVLVAVVQEASIPGVSNRRVDALVQALGIPGMSKSQVARVCADHDAVVEQFRTRQLEGEYP